jgi:CDP-diacylglycerol---serine O-phosphatidyltransferase
MAKIMRVAKHIPNTMTFFNIAVGVAAIMLSLSHEYEKAGSLILVSVIVDSFDGYVARMLKSTSKFGGYMDTISDFLAFALAASILVMNEFGVHPAFAAFFVMASVFRLWYFMKTKNTVHFFGVPTTVAGGLLACLAIIRWDFLTEAVMSFVVVFLSVMMLTRLKYYRVEIRKRRTLTLVIGSFMCLFAVSFDLFMLATLAMFLCYIFFGWTKWMRKKEVDSLLPEG